MRGINLKIPAGYRPVYLGIAQAIRQAIVDGRLPVGEKLPSTRELAAALGNHRNTIIAALNELVAEGWIAAEKRKGFRVALKLPSEYLNGESVSKKPHSATKTFKWPLMRKIELVKFVPSRPLKVAFRWGFPNPQLFPSHELRSHLADVLRRPKPEIFDYGSPRGHAPLLEALDDYLRRMRGVSGRSLFVMNGSGEGLYLLSQLLIRTGDRVALEALSYPSARETFQMLGAEIVSVPVQSDGMDVEALEKIVRCKPIKFLFITPLHQYPTTVILSPAKRLRLYELASKYDFGIIEDDYDHEFHYKTRPLLPLASHDPEERVLYTGTFSKVLFPSVRIGFVAVPKQFETPLMQFRRLITHQNDVIMQDAIARWMSSGGLERHLRRMRRHYEAQRNLLVEVLEREKMQGAQIEWHNPEGGMALWLNTNTDSRKLAERALDLGVFVSPEWIYRTDPKHGGPGTHLRIGFSSPTPSEIRKGIKILGPLFPHRPNF